ncbi:PqqD family protein [Streptomyces sp. SAJ15]|uniref:PqqD family protein n=1 Tax=Streptomyces sp. SAJ15 TaxID=2011095 RepID=UPI0037DA27D5
MLPPTFHVHHAAGLQGTAALDTRRGAWMMLDPDASRIWQAVTMRGGTAELADEIALPAGQDPQAVDGQITEFVEHLVAAGMLVDTDRPARRSGGDDSHSPHRSSRLHIPRTVGVARCGHRGARADSVEGRSQAEGGPWRSAGLGNRGSYRRCPPTGCEQGGRGRGALRSGWPVRRT